MGPGVLRSDSPRRRRDAQATRARLLAAALQEFAREGYAGARGERIARLADASERMLYYYFGSKEGLFVAVLEDVYARLRDAERSLTLDADDPSRALQQFCRFVWRYYADHPEFISVVNAENLERARHLRRSPQLPELATPIVGLLRSLLDRGCAAGVFRHGLDATELYLAIASLGYFPLSNQYTLSALLGRDLGTPAAREAHWAAASDLIARYVAH